ncbi:hypothetical protein [Selenomonas sp. ND2010]|jgi:hypothetical protein|uniref:hypothetical protein n=1 Tax=Selenomonas sp. ND2010 TaxID=1410618 RepID=UPI000A77F623|nr:hypothetical protein [Selenomonas sp. ND2010]
MNCLKGYIRTIRQYLATPKGSHDAKDYGRAIVLIVVTIGIVMAILMGGKWGLSCHG